MSGVAVSQQQSGGTAQGSTSTPALLRFLIAASGTGGHLIPAVHIAEALRSAYPHCEVEFIGAGKPLEETLVVAKGFKRHIIASAGIKRRGVLGVLSFITKFPVALFQLLRLYRSFSPSAVIGVGGYVSVLPVVVARLKGIPTWIHEAELHPGLANRALSRVADYMSVAFDETRSKGRARLQVTGHPVRQELRTIDRTTVREGAPSHLLVLGGSQGARGLDAAVPEIAPLLAEKGISVVHQSRPEEAQNVATAYRNAKVSAHVVSFIDDMPGAYEWADIIVSRAGASSVAEIGCVNRPAIFVPYPFQQGTHQTDNAKSLVFRQKALLVEETQPDFARRLKEALTELLVPANFVRMKEAPFEPRGLDAGARIAKGILELVSKRGT